LRLVSAVRKKRSRSRTIGPPSEKPSWRRRNGVFRTNAVSRDSSWSR
jgi:hypothetical protein